MRQNFDPDICVVFEIPPLKDAVQNNEKNELINEIIELIYGYYGKNSSVKKLSLHANIKRLNINHSNEHADEYGGYNHLYFDNVHLNHQHGVPLLKNWLLSHLLMTSNCIFFLNDFTRTKLLQSTHQLFCSNKTIVIKCSTQVQKQAPQLSIRIETVITVIETIITISAPITQWLLSTK